MSKALQPASTLTIAELSKTTGTKIPTIRFYESIGLLPEVPRTESNRRVYNNEVRNRHGSVSECRIIETLGN